MIYLISIISFSLSFLFLWKVIRYAYNHKIFDGHDERKIHQGNIPRVGGIAFVPAAFIAYVFALIILYLENEVTELGVHASLLRDSLFFLFAIAVIYFFGICDDLKGLRYRRKFTYQIITGLILCFVGIYTKEIHGMLALYHIPPPFGCFVTIFLMVLSINAFNFIDGIDGLSSSIAILSLGYYAVILYLEKNYFYLLAIAFLAALLPFFLLNVFGNKSKCTKVFMGDTGSTVLGLVLFLLALVINENPGTPMLYNNPLVLALAPLLLPFYDVFSVVFYRLLNAKNIFKADNNHFHHKLLRLGLTQPKALLVELLVFIFIIVITLLLVRYVNLNFIIGTSLVLWIAINMLMSKIIDKNNTKIIDS